MVGDTAFYAFRERIQQEIFRNISCFLIVTGLWVKAFLIFGRGFRRVVQSALYVSRGHLELKLIFFNSSKTTFYRKLGEKNLSFFYQIFSKVCQKCRVPFQTSTFKEVTFSRKLSFLLFCLHFERENSGRVVKKWTTLTEEQLRKVVFQFEWFDSWYWFCHFEQNFYDFGGKNSTGIQSPRRKRTTSGETSFFSNKLSISFFYFRFLRTISLDIQRKENQDLQNCI